MVRWLLNAAAGLLLLGALAGCSVDTNSKPSLSSTSTHSSGRIAATDTSPPLSSSLSYEVPQFRASDARRIEAGIASGEPQKFAESVAVPSGTSIAPSAIASLAAMKLRIDPSTFKVLDSSASTATVNATAGGKQWQLYLVVQEGSWKLTGSVLVQ